MMAKLMISLNPSSFKMSVSLGLGQSLGREIHRKLLHRLW
jgi:hypothetical protein